MTREVVFVGAARTAIGSYGGSLKDIPPADLGALVIKTALERAGVAPKDVGHVVLGNVIPSVPQDAYISRVAALNAGVPQETPAFNVNRLCGSGLQAIVSAAHGISSSGLELVALSEIPFALPATEPPLDLEAPISIDGVLLAGDYVATPSIQGALASGQRAALAALRVVRSPEGAHLTDRLRGHVERGRRK